MDANLLVTHDPSHAGSAKEEIEKALKIIKQKAKFLKSDVEGVFKLRVGNAKKIIKSLGKLKSKKSMFEHTFYWLPIDKWVAANIKVMQKEIKKLQNGIKKTEKKKEDLASAFQTQSLYIFPVMIGFFSFNFPVGLSLYWNTFTIFGIIQQYKISGLGGLKGWVDKIHG